MSVPRATTEEASDDGQYGVAALTSRPASATPSSASSSSTTTAGCRSLTASPGSLARARWTRRQQASRRLAVYQYFGVPPGASPEVDAAAARGGAGGRHLGVRQHRQVVHRAYPEDIKLYGLSWNTQLGTSGIAFQGEVSYREDAPLPGRRRRALFASLSPIFGGTAATNQVVPGGVGFSTQTSTATRRQTRRRCKFTVTKVFGPMLGADQGLLVPRPGMTHVFDMPDKSELRSRDQAPTPAATRFTAATGGAHAGKAYEDDSHFADATSWGYRLAGKMEYNNAIGAINLSPRLPGHTTSRAFRRAPEATSWLVRKR